MGVVELDCESTLRGVWLGIPKAPWGKILVLANFLEAHLPKYEHSECSMLNVGRGSIGYSAFGKCHAYCSSFFFPIVFFFFFPATELLQQPPPKGRAPPVTTVWGCCDARPRRRGPQAASPEVARTSTGFERTK